jgi:thiol:disulfide interchange protein
MGGKELPWKPYSRVALEDWRAKGATVLVDFTADW